MNGENPMSEEGEAYQAYLLRLWRVTERCDEQDLETRDCGDAEIGRK
jgi:hypothetical protein